MRINDDIAFGEHQKNGRPGDRVRVAYPPAFDDDLEGEVADSLGFTLEQARAAIAFFNSRQAEDVYSSAADLLSKCLTALFPPTITKISRVGLRAVALGLLVNRASDSTLSATAARYGVSKQLLSWYLLKISDDLEMHSIHSKSEHAREAYALATAARWAALSPSERKQRRTGKQIDPSTPDLTCVAKK